MIDYLEVTELSGSYVSREQIDRICNRYFWAGKYCQNKDVLEVACGTGQGLGYLLKIVKNIHAGDYLEKNLKIAQEHYGNRITLRQFDAQNMPYENNSMDVIILFEAIYFLPSAEKFISECRRVLRDSGKVLIATANKDLYDFNPSPYGYKYYGVVELKKLFAKQGFTVEFYGNTPVDILPWQQKFFRPMKKWAVKFGFVPKTLKKKKILKRLIFGRLVKMPSEIKENMVPFIEPTKLSSSHPDDKHKVIYCVATLQN